MSALRPRSLFWQVWLTALVQLAIVFGGFLAFRSWVVISSAHAARTAAALAMLEHTLGDDAQLLEVQRWLEREWSGRVSITRVDGEQVPSSLEAPLPIDPTVRARVLAGEQVELGDIVVAALPAREPRVVVQLRFAPMMLPRRQAGFYILLSVLGLAVLAWVLTRNVAGPVRQMVTMTARLTAGELSARTGLERRDELGELARALDGLAGRLQQAHLAERELLANVSHELRTPLARIRVALELAEAGDAEAARQSLTDITTDLLELQTLLDDVFTVARLASTQGAAALPLRVEPVSLATLLRRVQRRFAELWPAHRLEVLEAPVGVVDADPVLLRRAIDNLVDNAAKYSEPGSSVRLVTAEAEGMVRLRVVDEGCGVQPDELERVFTAFFRSERSRSRATGGVGLGLTLARSIVEAHGGTLVLESDGVSGSTAVLSVPVRPA
ncbi:MAG: HAMP domain-containing sensor histidine kinase [Myxococcales bacterium]|nr:HAMP domain-containing sensor histidine kinase [Myxococcales bacterium]MDP3501067.1 HAMP domain-containing sensor histidine kinase [Myxococcales bacterium]